MSNRLSRSGFSLVELLTAIAALTILLGLVLAGVMAVRSSTSRVEQANWLEQRRLGATGPRNSPLAVLFIGNSYTMNSPGHELPVTIQALVRASGAKPDFEWDAQVVGGRTLQQHWDDGIAVQKLRQRRWDFVVLQEQSQTPLFDRPGMEAAGKLFVKSIQDTNAIPMFYMTWAREYAPQQIGGLSSAYTSLAKSTASECVPAGLAWDQARTAAPGIGLYESDGSHPTPTGVYLTGCTFYAAFYDKSPVGLPSRLTDSSGNVLVDVPPATAAVLQTRAWQAMQDVKRMIRPAWR